MKSSRFIIICAWILSISTLATLSGCDACKDLDCKNNSTCTEGVCQCPEGFYGYECEYGLISTPPGSGYSCVTGNCVYDSTDAEYVSKAACLVECGNGGTSTAGYNCNNNGSCYYVSSNSQYATLASCENSCVPNTSGYDCNGGNCVAVGSNATYASLSDCQDDCFAYGSAIFWISEDLGCGFITVELLGETGTITNYTTGSAPACGTTGFATFTDVPVGTHDFYASCNGSQWTGYTVTITNNGCTKIKLS